ncbi:hypothetical protein [Lysobacter gummosus]|uniref:hypothetical protein n=1 Tax=Lysobacter gummosus TaxID=262324 RepID=UPI00362DC238
MCQANRRVARRRLRVGRSRHIDGARPAQCRIETAIQAESDWLLRGQGNWPS